MLHEFLVLNRDAIIEATAAKAVRRGSPTLSVEALKNGVPLFLAQLSETLRSEAGEGTDTLASTAIANGATKHGAELLLRGFTLSEVVHFYGDICQAITELAVTQAAPISVDEFRILNRSLDTAIAEAVTEHARLTAHKATQGETERLGQLAHELRNHVQTALLAFSVLKSGTVAVNGSTGTVLGRSLTNLRALIESTVAEVRLTDVTRRRARMAVGEFLADVAAGARLLSDQHEIQFLVEPTDSGPAIDGDPQLLASAVTNLLQNAFKFTRPGGLVVLRSRIRGTRVIIEIEDQCGGIEESTVTFHPFPERRALDRSGLGLGLSIARQAIHAHGGEMHFRNIAGTGCVFSIDLPLATDPDPALV
ncbi:MAG TPA: HAMP domain-containing sensor histidine kinase [Vicinamibacterales bacterium]|nr:HAMP domain-containing sensor histidine kinase [Vicinamibacterales bacterium]